MAALAGATGATPDLRPPHRSTAELKRRADDFLPQKYLVVDYYRIRRKLAYPLPIIGLSLPSLTVPSLPDYPWATWMLWALEERVNSLGWTAERLSKPEYARVAARDIEALCAWPAYCQYRQPDLSSAHAGRILWGSCTRWRWPNQALRQKVRAACARHVDEVWPLVNAYFGPIRSKEDLLALPEPYKKLPNIPVIGTIAAALTASAAGHSAAKDLHRYVNAIFSALLDLRSRGMTEAVGYDGYVLDFIADWLSTQPAGNRNAILNHPNFGQYLDESYMLSVPGAAQQVAELSDVEPREMTFHFSAQVKVSVWQPSPARVWLLRRWPLDWIRSDALALLPERNQRSIGTAPGAGALNAHYATVLRTGWDDRDLAVAMSCTNSPMAHVQNDNGTLVIGTKRRWIVCDPGYQQYMESAERDFTLGPGAHNYPLINGLPQENKHPRLTALTRDKERLYTRIELAGCYPAAIEAKSIARNVWLEGRNLVVITDEIDTPKAQTLAYHWHGDSGAAWWSRDGWILLHAPDVDLWFTAPQAPLSAAHILRLPGSRGQLTARAEISPVPPVCWWVFFIGDKPPECQLAESARQIQINGMRFAIG